MTPEDNSSHHYLECQVPEEMISLFRRQAEQKIQTEGWAKQGRHVEVKVNNFVRCWITEEAFKQLLIKENIWFRYRGLYFGDASGAGADFTVRINGQETAIGLRSINRDSLQKWKSVAYPDDRFQHEQDKIADYHLVCHQQEGKVKLYGAISKTELLQKLKESPRLYSPQNQEHFRIIPLECFRFAELTDLVKKMRRN